MNLDQVQKITEAVQSALTSLAILAGGVWTYYHYFRGRIHKPRVELVAAGSIRSLGNGPVLLTTLTLRNVGLSKLEISSKGTGMRVILLGAGAGGSGIRSTLGERKLTVSVFPEHKWIEPGETVQDIQTFVVKEEIDHGILLDVRLVSKGKVWRAKALVAKEIQP